MAEVFKFVNFLNTELVTGITAGSTAMEVPEAAAVLMGTLEEGEAVRLTLWDGQNAPEILDVVNNPLSGVVEIERAKEGTSAFAWPAGTQVQCVLTAELLTSFMESFFDVDLLLGANFLRLTGGNLSGPLVLAGAPGGANEAANRSWVESLLDGLLAKSGGTMTGDIDMGTTRRILRLAAPTVTDHAATKGYVDATAGLATARFNDDTGLVTGGSSTAYTVATNQTGLVLADGLVLTIRPHVTNGKNPTLQVNALAAKPIQNHATLNIQQNYLRAFMPVRLTYQASTDSFLLHGQTNDDGYAGDLKHSMQTADHGTWLLCDGRAISRTTYDKLFAVVGTKFGAGDGATTFNIMDGRGRVIAGADNMGGVGANRLTSGVSGIDGTILGQAGGSQSHLLTIAELPIHTHAVNGATAAGGTHNHTTGAATKIIEAPSQSVTNVVQDYSAGAGLPDVIMAVPMTAAPDHTHNIALTSAAAGTDAVHRNVQPTIVTNIFIHI